MKGTSFQTHRYAPFGDGNYIDNRAFEEQVSRSDNDKCDDGSDGTEKGMSVHRISEAVRHGNLGLDLWGNMDIEEGV